MIIGVSGKIGSGKDTFGNYFIDIMKQKYNINYENKKFADNLKLITTILTGVSIEDTASRDGKLKLLPEWNLTVGEILQILGTDAIRNHLHPDAWVLSLFSTYNSDNCNWIITDVRFKNEANYIKQKNGILIRLIGDPCNCNKNEHRNLTHQSEIDLDDYTMFDYVYYNKPPISNLYEYVDGLIEELRHENWIRY